MSRARWRSANRRGVSNFAYFEDLFAQDAKTPILVNVLAKSYRHVTLYNPGKYTLRLKYNGGMETLAHWEVKPLSEGKKAKNVILFVRSVYFILESPLTTSLSTDWRRHVAIHGYCCAYVGT